MKSKGWNSLSESGKRKIELYLKNGWMPPEERVELTQETKEPQEDNHEHEYQK
jgi:hypothetical protein